MGNPKYATSTSLNVDLTPKEWSYGVDYKIQISSGHSEVSFEYRLDSILHLERYLAF